MPEFYMIYARKNIFPEFLCPLSPTPTCYTQTLLMSMTVNVSGVGGSRRGHLTGRLQSKSVGLV